MFQRLILIAVLMLAANAAQAAPEFQFRAGVLSLEPAEGNAFIGVGLRFPVSDRFAISAEYATTFVDFTVDLGIGTIQILDLTQLGIHLDYTKSKGDWWATGRIGAVRSEAQAMAGDASDTSPSIGVEFGWQAIGIGVMHTELDGNEINAFSLMFRF